MLMSERIIPITVEPPTPLTCDSALELSCHLSVSFSLQIRDQGLVEFDLSSWTQLILISLCYALVLCHSFKSWALLPSLLFHALFLSPIQPTVLPVQSSGGATRKPLIPGRFSHLNLLRDLPVWESQEFNLPRDLLLENLSLLNLLWDPSVQGSQEVDMPRPAQGPNSQEANMPQPAWALNLQEAVMPQLAWDLQPNLGTPGSQVATVLGMISFRKTHP